MFDKLHTVLKHLGFDFSTFYRNLSGIGWYLSDFKALKKQLNNDKDFPMGRMYPILNNKYEQSGVASGHYFHQDLLIAQRIFENNPNKHVDIASRVDGFVAHVASFRPIEVFDTRPLSVQVPNITFSQADLMQLNPSLIDYTDSISCLHSIEHFGLGRYNDPIDAYGHLKGLNSIHQILKTGGRFYFSVPIGSQRIEFNAHRVFGLPYLLPLLQEKYTIHQFSYVDDDGALHQNISLDANSIATSCGCRWGCGIFELVKK